MIAFAFSLACSIQKPIRSAFSCLPWNTEMLEAMSSKLQFLRPQIKPPSPFQQFELSGTDSYNPMRTEMVWFSTVSRPQHFDSSHLSPDPAKCHFPCVLLPCAPCAQQPLPDPSPPLVSRQALGSLTDPTLNLEFGVVKEGLAASLPCSSCIAPKFTNAIINHPCTALCCLNLSVMFI